MGGEGGRSKKCVIVVHIRGVGQKKGQKKEHYKAAESGELLAPGSALKDKNRRERSGGRGSI